MDVQDILTSARDAVTVRRVFGEPYERDGITVIPAAAVAGGAGGGSGQDPGGGGGGGGGFGLRARPVGAYVIRGGSVRWEPSLDVNRIIIGGQILGLVALLVIRGIVKRRQKAARKRAD
jgi:uncharacterized spore protein YtfJ